MNAVMRHSSFLFAAVIAVVAVVISLSCTADIAGGGSEGGNARITGMITNEQGAPEGNVIVTLLPSGYNPAKDVPPADSCIDTTAEDGIYYFEAEKDVSYSIEAAQVSSRLRGLVTDVLADSTDGTVVSFSLKHPGAVRVLLADNLVTATGYLYIPGTTVYVRLNEKDDSALLDSVPAGILPSINYGSTDESEPVVIRNGVEVVTGDTVIVPWQGWDYSRKLTLNTSISGADVQENVYGFPVLVRLSVTNFDFSQAKSRGEDVRFTTADGRELSYEIERWDPVAELAEVWVKVDTVYGGDSTQSIVMYWGNPDASDSSNSNAVFDTADGFTGVWHMDDTSGDSVYDATANHFTGVSPDDARPQEGVGTVGACGIFDGRSDFIIMPNTANSKLNYPADGNFTVSAWIAVENLDGEPQLIVAKGYDQYFLRLTYYPTEKPHWEFTEYNKADSWQRCTTTVLPEQWTLLTGVATGDGQLLYCNGALVDATPDVYQADGLFRGTSYDLTIGKFLEPVEFSETASSHCFFNGGIDEVRIESRVRSSGWHRLSYMNQRSDDRLVVFR